MDQNTIELIKKLSDQLGVQADKVYNIALNQAKVEAVFDVMAIGLVFMPAFFYIFKKLRAPSVEEDDAWKKFGFAALGVILLFPLLVLVWELMTVVINPDYWTMKQLLSLLK